MTVVPRQRSWWRVAALAAWIGLRRMLSQWRLEVALLAGLIAAAAVTASVPIYTAASLQKSFQRDWLETGRGRAPFTLIFSYRANRNGADGAVPTPVASFEELQRLGDRLRDQTAALLDQEPRSVRWFAHLALGRLSPVGAQASFLSPSARLEAVADLSTLAVLVTGRWQQQRDDGVVEAVVDESLFERLELVVGDRFDYHARRATAPLTVELVGVYRPRDGTTSEDWMFPPPRGDVAFVHPSMLQDPLYSDIAIEQHDMQVVFDHQSFHVRDVARTIRGLRGLAESASRQLADVLLWYSPLDFFERAAERLTEMSRVLFLLSLPAMAVVLIYVLITAGLVARARESEIAVMSSRGGRRSSLFAAYLFEWLLLALVATAAGVLLATLIARATGSSAGFLRFVDREALPVGLSPRAWLFAAFAGIAATVMSTLPLAGAVRQTIVGVRRAQSRGSRLHLAHRWFIDVAALAVAALGFRELTRAPDAATLASNPWLFVVPVLLAIGGSLALLRLFALAAGAAARLASRFRGLVVITVLRRFGRELATIVPVTLLLASTVVFAVYASSVARSVRANIDARLRFAIGADLATVEDWVPPVPLALQGSAAAARGIVEPPFLMREQVTGVHRVARVLRANVRLGGGLLGSAAMMAIVPSEFAQVGYFPDAVLPGYAEAVLSALTLQPDGAIIGEALARQQGVTPGDTFRIEHGEASIDTYALGVARYWPGIDPRRPFVVLNLEHLFERIPLEVYQVWYETSEELDRQVLVDSLAAIGAYVTELDDAHTSLAELLREPFRRGFFGISTMGFMTSIVFSVLGLALHTAFSTRLHRVQFAALRATGATAVQVVAIVLLEQVLLVAVGLAAGTLLGMLALRLLMPLVISATLAGPPILPLWLVAPDVETTIAVALIAAVALAAVAVVAVSLLRREAFNVLRLGEE